MIYQFKVTYNGPTRGTLQQGASDITEIDAPNQRDAIKYGVINAIFVASGKAQPDECSAEIISPRFVPPPQWSNEL
jgi:hypothetical protein